MGHWVCFFILNNFSKAQRLPNTVYLKNEIAVVTLLELWKIYQAAYIYGQFQSSQFTFPFP